MARVNIPNGVREEAKHTYITTYYSSGWNGLTNTAYNSAVVNGDVLESALENDIITKKDPYGAWTAGGSGYFEVSVEEDFILWATGSSYIDSGGSSGKNIVVYKGTSQADLVNIGEYPTKTDSTWYKVFEGTKGYYRIQGSVNYVNFDELYFERKVLEKILLKSNNKTYSLKASESKYTLLMTSNTTPAPYVASASSTYSSTYSAWKAFNGTASDSGDSWITANGTKIGWIQIDFGEKKYVNKVTITNRNNGSDSPITAPKDFDILGSNDGVKFDILLKVINEINWKSIDIREFDFDKFGNYRYYRINVSTNNGANYTAIGDILFSFETKLIELPKATTDNFIIYGSTVEISRFSSVDTSKRYILQDKVSEDVNGLWVQELNRKPLSIKLE